MDNQLVPFLFADTIAATLQHYSIRVFHSLYKVGRNGNFVFKGFNNSKKEMTSGRAQPDATDYY